AESAVRPSDKRLPSKARFPRARGVKSGDPTPSKRPRRMRLRPMARWRRGFGAMFITSGLSFFAVSV
ncbi:MAG TPA: hypothetical protein VJR06_05670, partial [Nitrososphaerales archaeon]|nr:hypothetical protein [Nitrososphaerales archaeon]